MERGPEGKETLQKHRAHTITAVFVFHPSIQPAIHCSKVVAALLLSSYKPRDTLSMVGVLHRHLLLLFFFCVFSQLTGKIVGRICVNAKARWKTRFSQLPTFAARIILLNCRPSTPCHASTRASSIGALHFLNAPRRWNVCE